MDFLASLALDRIGFSVAAAAYLLFFLLILATKTRNLPKYLLLALAVITVCWAAYYIWSAQAPYLSPASYVIENARNTVLMLFLLATLSHNALPVRQFIRSKATLSVIAAMLLWTLICNIAVLSPNLIFTGNLLICIVQLALLETMYRRAADSRWQYKPLVLGLIICTSFDFVLLAESALFGEVDSQLWSARGFVYAAMLPLLIISVRRIEAWGINVYISRDIVLQSSFVLGAGVYLCLLAITGFYIRYIGGSWSNLIQTTFVTLGFAILIILLLSGSVRRKVKVFIEKHFFANKYDYRLKWLELTTCLKQVDISKPDQYQIILQAWLKAINYSRGCLLQIKAGDSIMPLAYIERSELSSDERKLIHRYIQHFRHKQWLIDLSDQFDPFVQKYDTLADIDCQLIVPVYADGQLWGLCLMNAPDVDRQVLNWELRDYLNLVTEQITSYLLLMQASQSLTEHAQFIAFSRMSAFVVHDLKNINAQINLLLKNSVKHRHNPEFIEDSFTTLEAMQLRLENMLSQLMNKRPEGTASSTFQIAEVLQQVIQHRCSARTPLPKLHIISNGSLKLDKERFISVIFHLIDNAQHATSDAGLVIVTLDCQQHMVLTIKDTGCGMSQEFIAQRLFRPFDSTKGNAGMGIGAYDALHFAEQHNGRLEVISQTGEGTTFTMTLPLHTAG
ncbi:PEP-CTERM system histidine kinase PrsK [Chromatiaceae bacterium AAb-1]|nr:PEP-CTERM system histidine kinase PrsK [Chromatiaceae bacterium AAb-1]